MNQSNSSNASIDYSYKWQDYVLLSLTGFGAVTSLINALIFSSRSLQDVRYKYMLLKSIAILIYMSLTFLNQILAHTFSSNSFETYFSALFTTSISIYLLSTLAIFRILLEDTLAIHTYSILLKRNSWFNLHTNKLIVILFLLSVTVYLNKPFGLSISQNPTTNQYQYSFNSFAFSQAYKVISIFQASLRIFLAVVVLFVINCFNVFEVVKWSKRNQIEISSNGGRIKSKLNIDFQILNLT